MSKEADEGFSAILRKIVTLEKKYEKIKDADPIARGHIGREILALVDASDVSTEYLRHCEMQIESEHYEAKQARLELMIRVIVARQASY